MKPAIAWTQRLKLAIADIAADNQPQDTDRQSLAQDIRARAQEMTRMAPGAVLQGHQIDYVSCLRQRLADHYVKFASAAEFESAWAEACRKGDA